MGGWRRGEVWGWKRGEVWGIEERGSVGMEERGSVGDGGEGKCGGDIGNGEVVLTTTYITKWYIAACTLYYDCRPDTTHINTPWHISAGH